MSKAFLCCAEPGAGDDCRHLRRNNTCVGPGLFCEHEPWPDQQSFWCWIRCHRMCVAGFKYHIDDFGQQSDVDTIKVCQCKLNDTAIPTFTDQFRRWVDADNS